MENEAPIYINNLIFKYVIKFIGPNEEERLTDEDLEL